MPHATSDHGPKRSRRPPGRQHDITPKDATRGRHPGRVPAPAHREAPSDCSPRGGTEAALTPQGCRATHQSGTRRRGTLAAPGAAAARRLPQHGGLSSARAWTEAMGVPTTPTPNGLRLPPIPDAGSRGPAPSGRTLPPFPRNPSERDRRRSKQTPTRQQAGRPARLLPPSQGQGDSTPRTHGQGEPRPTNGPNRGRGDKPLSAPPPKAGRGDTGHGPGHWPPDKLGPYTTGFPIPAATQPNRQGAVDAPRQREHNTSGPGGNEEMTETSGPQKSGDSPPTTEAVPRTYGPWPGGL